jgi:spermidine synthase
MRKRRDPFLFYVLFGLSGFSGVMYEAIWSHYLKLFLGHAAYAQALVLATFMGGMALGAWLASRYSVRLANLIRSYAVVEGLVGLVALLFHPTFEAVSGWVHFSWIPNMGSSAEIQAVKWTLGTALILPQSILLGMTFPLMSGGLVRRKPESSGSALSVLYFANSLGAAIGVLVSGFVLIEWVGLPGTVMTAGLINFALAIALWFLGEEETDPPVVPDRDATSTVHSGSVMGGYGLMLGVAWLTGTSSFMYEMGWIRMLSLVLGASTHAFEMMLSAFIFGLAFGGLWIRGRIDRFVEPTGFLGWVQVAMGVMALMTLPLYGLTFEWMEFILKAVRHNEYGYSIFNVSSHLIALLLMVPATFCAGMTLPLITFALLRKGHGERAIGGVYAANTLGAILGVVFSIHIGMVLLGLKGLIALAGALDMGLGLVLLGMQTRRSVKPWVVAGAVSAGALCFVLWGVDLDFAKMASGVYRYGRATIPKDAEVIFHKDGRTATVDLIRHDNGTITLAVNGKPEAGINLRADKPAAPDESTMVLLGALPLMHHPEAEAAAAIGLGSGLTAHVLLASDRLARLDTIEIEASVVEAAKRFRPRVDRVFEDPRSRIHIEDAKAFLANHRQAYDIVVSEPSNPWMSGVASLFSTEFYRLLGESLKPDGIFVQWLHIYETDITLVSSIVRAFSPHFDDYVLYVANDEDIVIVLKKSGKLRAPDPTHGGNRALMAELQRVRIATPQDLHVRSLAGRELLEPFFASYPAPVNSDYFPYVDLNATRARFMGSDARALLSLGTGALPILEMLGRNTRGEEATQVLPARKHSRATAVHQAAVLRDFFDGTLDSGAQEFQELPDGLRSSAALLRLSGNSCGVPLDEATWLRSIRTVADAVLTHLNGPELESIWERVAPSTCVSQLRPGQTGWLGLLKAVGRRDATEMVSLAEELLAREKPEEGRQPRAYLVASAMVGYLAQKAPERARQVWTRYGQEWRKGREMSMELRLLVALSFPGSPAAP